MPDWNAEIIGRRPKRLALDLYKFLVTDQTWAIQRAEYGYKTQPEKLMYNFESAYVDVRAALIHLSTGYSRKIGVENH